MINLGKTFGNLMIDLQVTNIKLQDRAVRIIQAATQCEATEAEGKLLEADNQVKVAIAMILLGVSADEARAALKSANSRLREVVKAPHTN
jgi:N-acetylmuramic acid 6-phosphate etherase